MKKKYLVTDCRSKKLLFYGFSLIFSMSLFGQTQGADNSLITVDWDICKYYPNPYTQKSTINVSNFTKQKMANGGGGCTSFIVNFNGFTPEAEAAFQFAIDIWANSIESSIPIRVSATFGPLDSGVLGGAGPAGFVTVPSGSANTVYPLALAEKIIGAEIPDGPSPTSTDIVATFSSTANFYFGLDANTPGGQVDFVSVVLHELGHGLGILGFGRVPTDVDGNPDPNPPVVGVLRNSGFLSPWDNFIENGLPTAITTFPDPSAALLAEFTSNDLFSNGPIATFQNGGVMPSTYAPSTFNQGSSYSHWDESIYPAGNANSLMTPFISPGEAIHNPGLVTLGFMEDMGWSICGGSLTVENYDINTVTVNPNPFTSSIAITISNGFNDDYKIKIFDINGRSVLNETKTATNGTIRISNLDVLEDALFFVKITNVTSGASITKKIIKN